MQIVCIFVGNEKKIGIMKANFHQLKTLNILEKDYGIKVISDYEFNSQGSIIVLCKDEFGEFSILIDVKGLVTSK